jgi:hypothetical protein
MMVTMTMRKIESDDLAKAPLIDCATIEGRKCLEAIRALFTARTSTATLKGWPKRRRDPPGS